MTRSAYAVDVYFPNDLTVGDWDLIHRMEADGWIRENVPAPTHWSFDVLDERAVDVFPHKDQVVFYWSEPVTPSDGPMVT